jgi:hypothetical protein
MCKLNITCAVLDGACSCSAQPTSEIVKTKQNSLLSEILSQIKRNLIDSNSDTFTETNENSTEYSVSPDHNDEEIEDSALIDLVSPPLSSAIIGKPFAFIFELRGRRGVVMDPTELKVTLKSLENDLEVELGRLVVKGTCFFRKVVPAEALGKCLITVTAEKEGVSPLVMQVNVRYSRDKIGGKKRKTQDQ